MTPHAFLQVPESSLSIRLPQQALWLALLKNLSGTGDFESPAWVIFGLQAVSASPHCLSGGKQMDRYAQTQLALSGS